MISQLVSVSIRVLLVVGTASSLTTFTWKLLELERGCGSNRSQSVSCFTLITTGVSKTESCNFEGSVYNHGSPVR